MAPESYITYHRDEEALLILGLHQDRLDNLQSDINAISNTISNIDEIIKNSGGGLISESKVNTAGQTFTQLLTEQPNKFNQNGSPVTSSSQITINWNYTDIIPTEENIRKFAQGSTKSRCLPYINQIKIQINGTVTGAYKDDSDKWLDYETLDILSTQDYNTTNSLKNIILTKIPQTDANNSAKDNILSKTESFFVRIYGINDNGNDNDFPNISTRALVIEGVAFAVAFPPSQPVFQSDREKFSNKNNYYLTSNFKVDETETGVTNSTATLDNYITTFSEDTTDENRSLRSDYFSLNSQSGTTMGTLDNITNNTDFTIKIGDNDLSLRAGTKYNYKVSVSNNISSENSEYSIQKLSPYTRLPTSLDIGTTLILTAANQTTYVTSSTFTDHVIYLNNNISGKEQFKVANANSQTFEITKPYSINQETTTGGFGRYVDNADELVSISFKIGDVEKEKITFNGFNIVSGDVGTPSQIGTTYFDNATIQDMYFDNNNKGFRLSGTVSLNDINNIYTNIGTASSNAYNLKYVYQRSLDVDETTSITHIIVFVDDLSGSPNLSVYDGPDSIIVNSVKYCMGIPSVENFAVNLKRKYENINSVYKFIRGDKLIGRIESIENVSWTITDFKSNPIDDNGEYINDYSSQNKYYTDSKNYPISGDADNLTITEYAYSLAGTTKNATNKISVNHYYDENSFTRNTTTTVLTADLNLTDVYEIENSTELAKLGINLGGIGVKNYENHTDLVKNHTLLYINGHFASNASFNYPDVNNYTWDVNIPNKYNSGTLAFNTSGTAHTSGYKWIVFKVKQEDYSTDAISGTTYNYYNVKGYLENTIGIREVTVSKIKDKENIDAIGFIKQSVLDNQSGSYVARVGNLSRDFNSTNAWYSQVSDISYTKMTTTNVKANYGVNYNALNGWGPLLDIDNGSNDIYIFIGFKNDVVNLY